MSEQVKSRAERMRERQNQSVTGGSGQSFKALILPDGVEELKLEIEQPTLLDIVPFLVDEKHPLYASVMKNHEEYGDRADDWCVEYVVHKGIKGLGEVICNKMTYGPQHRCPICEAKKEQMDATGVPWGDDSLSEFRYSKRVAYIVTKLVGEDEKFYVLSHPASWLHRDLTKKADEQGVLFLDTSDKGHSVQLLPVSHSFPDNKGNTITIPGKCVVSFQKREFGYEEEDLVDVPKLSSFLNKQTYEEIYAKLHGLSENASTPNKPTTVVEESAPVSRAARRNAVASEAPTQAPTTEDTPVTVSRRRRTPVEPVENHDEDITF